MTVMRAKTRRPSGLWQTPSSTTWCGCMPSMRWPRNVIVPARGLSSPEMVRRVVDLPAPFEPMRVTISPSSIVRDAAQRVDRSVVGVDVVRARGAPCQASAAPRPR